MPATPSEAEQLIQKGQLEGFNLLLTVISKLTEWPAKAKQYLGVGGDIQAEHRLLRADFANARQTAIEAKIVRATESLYYHFIESCKHTGAEKENHKSKVKMYLRYLNRIQPNKDETARTMASVWPWPQMMRAALTTVAEGGTASLVSQGLGGIIERITTVLTETAGSLDAPPPPPALADGSTTEETEGTAEA